jgi:cytochrome c oxidase cbb3-type subunit 3
VTTGQSLFIIVLTVGNIAGCLWLLWWTRRSPGEGATTDHTTGHIWDEDIRELNNPLPRWWLWLFIITVVFGVVYLALYPGLGTWQGTLAWTSRGSRKPWRRSVRAAWRSYRPIRPRSTSAATCT